MNTTNPAAETTLYSGKSHEELKEIKKKLEQEYNNFCARGLDLNMARGKPSSEQLALSLPMFDMFSSTSNFNAEDGTDCLNYGVLTGIPEAKRLMSWILDEPNTDNIIVGGNSSLSLIFDAMSRLLNYGCLGSKPWREYEKIKWICFVPGYDRHFAILDHFGIEPVCVPLGKSGPDMDAVEDIVANDETVKGLVCVPKYSNPSGITFSDEVVRRLASMKCAAADFCIFWDMAYNVHHLNDSAAEQDQLLDIAAACNAAGNPNRYMKFGSTSKITFAGSGVSGISASAEILKDAAAVMQIEMIGYNKVNQLMHARFLDSKEALQAHMVKHAHLLKPKFDLVQAKLEEKLGAGNFGRWTRPRGGYFITFWAPQGCAKRIVALARSAGMVLTGAGSTWPHVHDPYDSDIRIAPSLPPLEELDAAMDLFCCCVKLASAKKELGE